jgi:hypothetical protein
MDAMLTRDEYLAKAAELELRAAENPELRDQCLHMAEQWRRLAEHAKWQDAYRAGLGITRQELNR